MKLKDVEKELKEIILAIKSFDLNVKVNFLRPLPFKHVYDIWKGRVLIDSYLLMSDSLGESFKVYGEEQCILLYMMDKDFFLILFLNETKTKVFGHIQKDLRSGSSGFGSIPML